MKTINDLPVKVLANILFFTTPRIDIFIEYRLINSKWNEAVKHRLSMVKHIVQDYYIKNDPFDKTPIFSETMFSIDPSNSYFDCSVWRDYTRYFDSSDWDDNYTRYFISLMEMLPDLKAVHMNFPRDLSVRNEIFSYFNTRTELKALGLGFNDDFAFEPENQGEVKLENITMLSIQNVVPFENFETFIESLFSSVHEFQQLWLYNDTHAGYIFQKMPKIRKLYHTVPMQLITGTALPLVMPTHPCDLEILGVDSSEVDILEYLSEVTRLSSKLTSIHVVLCNNEQNGSTRIFKKFNQVENLVIEYKNMRDSFSYAEKILKMYPMVRNLSIKYSSNLNQDTILGIFRWMPNLSNLHLTYLKNLESHKVLRTINVDHLVSAYYKVHGRLIEIRVVESMLKFPYKEMFKRGFDFMKHIFYSDFKTQPHILLE